MRQLITTELPDHIGKRVDITLPDLLGFDTFRYCFFVEYVTYNDAVLLEYDDNRLMVRFLTRNGEELFLSPLMIFSKETELPASCPPRLPTPPGSHPALTANLFPACDCFAVKVRAREPGPTRFPLRLTPNFPLRAALL